MIRTHHPIALACLLLPQEVKQRVERDVERWGAAKRRRVTREASSSSNGEVDNNDTIDEPIHGEICVETKRTISVQTELTMTDITALQVDNESRQEEVRNSEYPTREQLQADKKFLIFYTGIPHFTILIALFEFVIKALYFSANSKLSPFDLFILTLMKLRLNPPNQDLAFRYEVSVAGHFYDSKMTT